MWTPCLVPRILSIHPAIYLFIHIPICPLSHQNLPGYSPSICWRYRDKQDYLSCTFIELVYTPTRCSILYYLYQATRPLKSSLVLVSKDIISQTSPLIHPHSPVMLLKMHLLVTRSTWARSGMIWHNSSWKSLRNYQWWYNIVLTCMGRSSHVLVRVIGYSFFLSKTFLFS